MKKMMSRKLFLSLLSLCPLFALGQDCKLSGNVSDTAGNKIAFANIALFLSDDTTRLVKGDATDLKGNYELAPVSQGNYVLQVSFIGYKPVSQLVQLNTKNSTVNVKLQPSEIILDEVSVTGNRSRRGIDKIAYTFSEDEMKEASQALDLTATIPNLMIDKTSNSLSSINGKSVLILLNGIRATDEDLRLIPADKIKNVEYYDVPTMRYQNDAEIVVNVRTKPLDTGWSGSFRATAGQMYSNGSASLSYVKGDQKFTLNYGPHFNTKHDVNSTEHGLYNYAIGDKQYGYQYDETARTWSNQHLLRLTYGKSKDERYDFQVKASLSTTTDHQEANKNILLSINQNQETRTGSLTDRIHTLSPILDVYYNRYLSKSDMLSFNVVGSLFKNDQKSRSTESGATGFDDELWLDNSKKSVIGEAVFTHNFKDAEMTIGYQGKYNFLNNELSNSLSESRHLEDIRTQKHYFYGDISGEYHKLMYRASIGGNIDKRLGNNGFSNLTFTPVFLIGYKLNKANSLRLQYTSNTLMPNIQQLSESRILIMKDFYQTGNKNLRNAHQQTYELSYDLYAGPLTLQTTLYHERNTNSFFDNYQYGNDCILRQTANADRDIRQGGTLSLNYRPIKAIRIGLNFEATRQEFRPTAQSDTYRDWTYPMSLMFSARHKGLAFTYYQKFGGHELTGLYKTGIEKVSYVNLEYEYHRVTMGVRCFFPFVKDRYTMETIPGSLVMHRTENHLKYKDHAIAFDIAWRFNSGKRKSIDVNLENSDEDRGSFKVK